MIFKVIWILLILFSVKIAASDKGIVYLIPGSDTSTNPYSLTQSSNMLWPSRLYTNPNMNGYTVLDSSFRNQYRDSYGTPLKMTWWMMGGNVFDLSKNCNIPVRNNFTIYLMQKYYLNSIQQLNDQLSLHYHNYVWSDPNGDGIFHWNQGMDFNLNKYDYEQTLCKYLIENNVFPISFRSGWHYMDNAWQAYQEKFIPFDMSNAYPAHGGSVIEPTWWIDWSQSPSDFVPYHPNANNYQIVGDLKQWRLRSLFIQDYTLLWNNLEIMFQEAATGNDQMACVWGHLAESGFLNGLNNLHIYLQQLSAQYNVNFKYCRDIEGMRTWINPADTIPPTLIVSEILQGNNIRFRIETDGPVFQTEEPFVTIKTTYETYERLACSVTGTNQWETIKPVPAFIIAKVAVAVCDSVGNQAKIHIDYLPDDIFIDDQQPEYQEISGTWQDYQQGELWNLNSRLLHGTGSVIITPNIQESRPYKISFHGPGSNSNSVRCIMQNSSITDTIFFNSTLLGTDHWQTIGVFDLESGTGNTLTIENLSPNKDLGLDVIRFSPLVPEKYAYIEPDSIIFGDVSAEDTIIKYISINNYGSDVLNIHSMTHSGNKITVMGNLPDLIYPGENLRVPIAFYTHEYGAYIDTIVVQTDDPLHSLKNIPVYANAHPYFKLVDNDDPSGYSEFGAQWFTSNATAYGPSSRCAWILANGMHADFTPTLKYNDDYDIQYIVPTTQNAHNHVDYILLINGNPVDTVDVDQNLGSGEFQSIGIYNLPNNIPVTLRIQDNGGNTQTSPHGIVLRADAVKFVRVDPNSGIIKKLIKPHEYKLLQNYPNPFNPTTTIEFTLPTSEFVRLKIYNLPGQEVTTLVSKKLTPGNYKYTWDASTLASGVYVYEIRTANFHQVRKMIYLK